MEFTKEEQEKLDEIIKGRGSELYENLVVAKDNLDELAGKVKEQFGLKAAAFKKMVEMNYEGNKEELKEKANLVFELYEEIVE